MRTCTHEMCRGQEHCLADVKAGLVYRPDVVAGKYDPSLFDETGEYLLINEIFYSVQGEGEHTGEPTVFIRLAKCNLACKFCDTEFETYTKMHVDQVLARAVSLVATAPRGSVWVDLTGGEPLLQNCGLLVGRLQSHGFKVGCETNGALWAGWAGNLDWITCSPKVPKQRIPFTLQNYASEFKWIVNAAFLAQYERDPYAMHFDYATNRVGRIGAPINWLQPESLNPKWTEAATKLVLAHPEHYRLSLQTHKYGNNR